MNESTTNLHVAIECPAERQGVIDFALLEDAMRGNRGTDQQRIATEAIRWAALLLRKNKDYGSSAWRSPMLAPDCDPGVAIRVRMSDKLNRLITLLSQRAEVASESIDDTMRDLGAYCLLELARPFRKDSVQ